MGAILTVFLKEKSPVRVKVMRAGCFQLKFRLLASRNVLGVDALPFLAI